MAPNSEYGAPHNQEEHERLLRQHAVTKYTMGGRLIWAPLSLTTPSLRILDSATSSGGWLVDVAQSLNAPAALVGADFRPLPLIPEDQLPPNFSLIVQNIRDPWPSDFLNSFDLVHQRFILGNFAGDQCQKSIRGLWDCVKPGGYIQLVEIDATTLERGPGHEAIEKFADILHRLMKNPSVCSQLEGWVRDLPGAIDVEAKLTPSRLGAYEKEDSKMGQMAQNNIVDIIDLWKLVGCQLPGVDWDKLKADVKEELTKVGNLWSLSVVWAKKSVTQGKGTCAADAHTILGDSEITLGSGTAELHDIKGRALWRRP